MNALDTQLEGLKHLKEELEKSPLFSASLGSKELFHSNMIAWMCEQWPEKMGEVFSRLLTTLHNDNLGIGECRGERSSGKTRRGGGSGIPPPLPSDILDTLPSKSRRDDTQ